jgi:hypothetical protein
MLDFCILLIISLIILRHGKNVEFLFYVILTFNKRMRIIVVAVYWRAADRRHCEVKENALFARQIYNDWHAATFGIFRTGFLSPTIKGISHKGLILARDRKLEPKLIGRGEGWRGCQ